jgi:hypothetical protein
MTEGISTLENFSKKVIAHGVTNGYPWAIVRRDHPIETWQVFLGSGQPCWWFCGYVGLDKSHPYFGKPFDERPVSSLLVHGGLSYSEPYGDLWVLGWDYGHYDSPDYDTNDEAIAAIAPEIQLLIKQLMIIKRGTVIDSEGKEPVQSDVLESHNQA